MTLKDFKEQTAHLPDSYELRVMCPDQGGSIGIVDLEYAGDWIYLHQDPEERVE